MKRLISQMRWPIPFSLRDRRPPTPQLSAAQIRARHDRALLHLSRCALKEPDGAKLLADLCRITSRAIDVDHVHVLELLPDGRTLIGRAASGWTPQRLALWQLDVSPESRVAKAMHNRTLMVLDRGADGGTPANGGDLLRAIQMQSGIVAGVSAAQGSYALLGLYSSVPRRFTREELQFVRGVGHIIESTLERNVQAASEKATRLASHADQADLLRIIIGRLGPALRDSVGHLYQFRTTPTDSFTFRKAVRQTERQVASIAEFIEDLRLFAELLDGWRPGGEAVLLAPMLASVLEHLGARAHENNVSLQLRMSDELIACRGDAQLIRRAIFNIVDNALRFTGEGGSVSIHVTSANTETVALDVVDTGRGMTAAQVQRLINRNEGSLRSEHRGAGLGWRLAAAIVEAHGGTLSPASGGPDLGSTIRIGLPRANLGERGISSLQ